MLKAHSEKRGYRSTQERRFKTHEKGMLVMLIIEL